MDEACKRPLHLLRGDACTVVVHTQSDGPILIPGAEPYCHSLMAVLDRSGQQVFIDDADECCIGRYKSGARDQFVDNHHPLSQQSLRFLEHRLNHARV
jgi:hypothetical protein